MLMHGVGLLVQEEIENCHCAMVAVRGVTALLLDTLRVPQAGNPANSRHGYASRNKPVAFLQTRCFRLGSFALTGNVCNYKALLAQPMN